MPDLAQKNRRASQGAKRSSVPGSRFKVPGCLVRKILAQTEKSSNRLKPMPMPAPSSVGNSPTAWKPDSKLATIGPLMNEGRTDRPCWFHQPAKGNNGGGKLLKARSKALPQMPTTGCFIANSG